MSTLANYSIKDLEILTDIKSHTIRIWEKRYAILDPDRTETNIRKYNNDDLTKLLNVSLLNKQGYKISKIAAMSDTELRKLILESISPSENADIINGLIVGMIELDEIQLNLMMTQAIDSRGFEKAIAEVIFPFFHRIGVMWQAGAINPAQEHFVTHLVRQKVISATDQLKYSPDPLLPKILLFLPEKELHELSLLLYNYALRSRGFATIYLSQAVPINTIERIAEITKPDIIVCTLTNPLDESEMQTILNYLTTSFNGPAFLSGKIIHEYQGIVNKNIMKFTGLEELLQLLKTFSKNIKK